MQHSIILFLLLLLPANRALADSEESDKPVDVSLEEYVQLALGKGLTSINTKSSFQSTTYSFKSTRRDLLAPRLSLSAQSSRSRNIQKTSITTSDSLTSRVSLSQPFIWGGDLSVSGSGTGSQQFVDTIVENEIISSVRTYDRTLPSFSASYKQPLHIFIRNQKWRSWKKNNISYTSSKNSFSRDIQNLEVEARSLYFDTLVTLSKTEVERQKLKSSKILLSITQALVEAGKTAPVELTRAQINYKLDERRVRNAEIATQQTLNSFKNLVLIPETQEVRLTSKLQYVPQQLSLKALQDYAIAHRLDLQNSQMNVTLSEIGLKETKETNRPQLATSASYKYDTQVTGDRPESWDVSASMDWNFFDSRINALRIKEKVLSLENTRRQLDSLRRQILVEVQNGYLEFVRTDEQIADFAETRKQAENNLSAVRLRYERGLDRLIDVFDAESKLRDLDLEYLSLLVSYNKSVDKLGILIGAKLEEAFK